MSIAVVAQSSRRTEASFRGYCPGRKLRTVYRLSARPPPSPWLPVSKDRFRRVAVFMPQRGVEGLGSGTNAGDFGLNFPRPICWLPAVMNASTAPCADAGLHIHHAR